MGGFFIILRWTDTVSKIQRTCGHRFAVLQLSIVAEEDLKPTDLCFGNGNLEVIVGFLTKSSSYFLLTLYL